MMTCSLIGILRAGGWPGFFEEALGLQLPWLLVLAMHTGLHSRSPILMGKPGLECSAHTPCVGRLILGSLEAALLEGRTSLPRREPLSCCPDTAAFWSDYRVRGIMDTSAATLGSGPKPLAVSFTSSYLQPRIRLIKKLLPVGS